MVFLLWREGTDARSLTLLRPSKPSPGEFTRAAKAQLGSIFKVMAFLKAAEPKYLDVHQHLTQQEGDEYTVTSRLSLKMCELSLSFSDRGCNASAFPQEFLFPT